MAIDSGSGSTMDVNSILNSFLAGGNMLGDKSGGMDAGLLALLLVALRGGLLGGGVDGNQNADRAAIDAAVSAALAQNNQANNNTNNILGAINTNSMTLLKDIQDTGQDLTNTITNGNQNLLVQMLQGQLSTANGIGDVKQAISTGNANIINEVHESNQDLSNQLNTVNTNMLKGFSDLASKIDQNLITELREQLADARNGSAIARGNVEVTNNINQNQAQAQQQQQIANINATLGALLPYLQNIGQSVVNLGTMSGAAGQQTAANTRVNA
jgi:hypothetical protein